MNGAQLYDLARYLEQLKTLGIPFEAGKRIANQFINEAGENYALAIEGMKADLARRRATQVRA